MTRITISLDKSVEENSSVYFEKSKKSKKKLEGAKIALEISKKKYAKILDKQQATKAKEKAAENKKKEWYEKFHWFYSSEGFLVIGGRDSTTNEIIIKKYTEKDDIVFHTDMSGSPFFVIKTKGKIPGKETMQQAADATASYSSGWKKGISSQNVFHVKPEQVSKKAKAGESLPKGAFMIYGKTEYLENKMKLAIGIKDNSVIGGPLEAVRAVTKSFAVVIQGNNKASDTAKEIKKKIGGELDDIIRFLPAGGTKILQ